MLSATSGEDMKPAVETCTEPEPRFGLYLHWPFCAQKCPYCDFNSHVRHAGWDEARLMAAYRRELDWVADEVGHGRDVATIFIGGGTPSLMQAASVASLLDHIAGLFAIASDAEITIEANPGSVEAGRFAGYRAAGVNRVSLGVQSLDDAQLRRLGRIHTVEEARVAIGIAQAKFDRVSFDLIYARPGQSLTDWRRELSEALQLAVDHLSLYQLTIEPGTPFAALHKAGKLHPPEDEVARALYDLTQEMTAAAGLPAYEISNHARPGQESRHNMLYWRYGHYAGVGPGAHGRLPARGDRTSRATVALRGPEAWMEAVERSGHGLETMTRLSFEQQADEMLLMGLRIAEGLDLRAMARRTGLVPDVEARRRLSAEGLVDEGGEARLRATPAGRMVLDWIVTELATSLKPAAGIQL
ncbi:MAG: radical SAM family heme chaperone HemW [Hyphomicrobiaceae bacterium]